jgi:hypothetical protein
MARLSHSHRIRFLETTNLLSGHDWYSEQLLIDAAVKLEDLTNFNVRFLLQNGTRTDELKTCVRYENVPASNLGLEGSMTLLPQELASAEEWLWVLELPSDDVAPLIDLNKKTVVAYVLPAWGRGTCDEEKYLERQVAV